MWSQSEKKMHHITKRGKNCVHNSRFASTMRRERETEIEKEREREWKNENEIKTEKIRYHIARTKHFSSMRSSIETERKTLRIQ